VCSCFECLRRGGLETLAPRLSQAQRDWWVWREQVRHARSDVLDAERLLAHRELQMLRAGRSNKRHYVKERQRKLREAERLVRRFKNRLDALEAN
jgi:hypothetical protein